MLPLISPHLHVVETRKDDTSFAHIMMEISFNSVQGPGHSNIETKGQCECQNLRITALIVTARSCKNRANVNRHAKAKAYHSHCLSFVHPIISPTGFGIIVTFLLRVLFYVICLNEYMCYCPQSWIFITQVITSANMHVLNINIRVGR